MSQPFHIYRSSAGSGKTYTLAREYLRIALSQPHAFRNVLGVTFTNKASEEMKNRILRFLKELKNGSNDTLAKELGTSLGLSVAEVRTHAEQVLKDILHNYGRFSIVTIDSFFHQVIRSFAKEIGLQGTFTIDLDQEKILQEVIDLMLMDIGEEPQKELRAWLTQFAGTKVDDGKSWDFKRDIEKLGKELMKDQFKTHAAAIDKLSEDPTFFETLKRELNQIKYSFEERIRKVCLQGISILHQFGIDPAEFKGGSTQSPALLFERIEEKSYELTKTQRAKYGNPDEWLKAKDPNNGRLQQAIEAGICRCYDQVVDIIDQETIHYQSAVDVLQFFFTFGILTEINKYLQRYREEHDLMLIADLPDFLRSIIHDSDTPYIYEKVGSRYQHYLIDEFQDTSTFQWDNFKPLVKNGTDSEEFSMVVGDVKQSIYRFRGGDWELLQSQIREDIGMTQVSELFLDTNYRSALHLVAFNNDLFPKIREQGRAHFIDSLADGTTSEDTIHDLIALTFDTYTDVVQQIHRKDSVSKGCLRIEFISEEDVEGEGKWMDEAIRRTIEKAEELQRSGYALRDMAILTRYSGEGRQIANAFAAHRVSELADPNLKYEVVSSEALYLTSSHVVRFIVSLIKWLNEESNAIVCAEWLHEYTRYILKKEATAFHRVGDWKALAPAPFVKHKDFLKTLPLYEMVESIIRLFGLDKVKEEYTYLQGFQDGVLDYTKTERGDIPAFLLWWEEEKKERSIKLADENDAIKIMTIHKSKGLEFPVVLLPFMSWSMDHDQKKDNILWCRGGTQEPFDKLPLIPLRYGKSLTKTYWAEDYYKERLKAFLDNMNLIYVAFTRPAEILWAAAPRPKRDANASVSELIYKNASTHTGWNDTSGVLQLGEINQRKQQKEQTGEYGLQTYHSHPWRGKVSVQIKGAAEMTGAIGQGIQLHQLLSKIRYKEDLGRLLPSAELDLLRKAIDHPEISDWFDESWRVDTEVPILLPGGEMKRIDRINRRGDETLVIDFKTGAIRDSDQAQVRQYMALLEQMSFKQVVGRLVYLSDLQVVNVL